MATNINVENLVINKIKDEETYDYIAANNLFNSNEVYSIEYPNTSVRHTEQELTEAQKVQARTNIDAASTAIATTTAKGLMSTSDKIKLNGIASGATANTGTITKVQANGTDIASSGTANIPAASTSEYGVTKLSSSTSDTSTTTAATPSAVKAAYDLANSKAPKYTYGTSDLTAGSSSLATGTLYFVYE